MNLLDGISFEALKLRHEFTPVVIAGFIIGLAIFLFGLWSTYKTKIIDWLNQSRKWKNFIELPKEDKILIIIVLSLLVLAFVVFIILYFV